MRYLRNDGDAFSKIGEAHLGDVEPVDLDASGRQLDDAEESHHDGRLSSASSERERGQSHQGMRNRPDSPPNDSYLLARANTQV